VHEPIRAAFPLGFQWRTFDPFLFCVHHRDAYPAGNEALGPRASLAGREIGQDFAGREGWNMYHGETVPGFPAHPHRGFETVTIVERGFVDHADSAGALARYGMGDVQWLTAGSGVVHSEMFPLLEPDRPNPLELFQIWLNLAPADKRAPADFAMFWRERIPRRIIEGEGGAKAVVTVVAGRFGDVEALPSPAASWAAREGNEVAIWILDLDGGAALALPPASADVNRALYFFEGSSVQVASRTFAAPSGIVLVPDVAVDVVAQAGRARLMLLQGKPIGAPVVQHGPFVMNSADEIRQTFADYRRTGFGRWPWPSQAPVHRRGEGRFARHADGRVERGGD
jgi:redox-sensitive bicupin YhaK (pirin superfamily)